MAVDHTRIKKLLGEKEEAADTSLRAKSLERAMKDKVPTTLTPHEWEQWYAAHGVPESHKNPVSGASRSWWRRWFRKDS